MIRSAATFLLLALLGFCVAAYPQVTYTGMASADAFLSAGSSNNPAGSDLTLLNFGRAGLLVVAPAFSAKGEFQSVIKFDLAPAVSVFDTAYGTNSWTITGISLELTSNYGTAGVQPNNPIFPAISGGQFVIEWLAKNDWVEGTGTPSLPTTDGVTYASLPELLSGPRVILCTNTYSPPGNNVHVTYHLPPDTNLVANVAAGSNVSLLFYAADNQVNYLFNSRNYGGGNVPLIHVTTMPLLQIFSCDFTNDVCCLTGLGAANSSYQVQATSDLTTTNWETLGIVSADNTGAIKFDDATATNHTQRYYRLSR
jgi:hypothetical protein